MAILNPWDVAPVPEFGDENANTTHEAKGRATSNWETAEVAFSNLYACFRGGSPFDDPIATEYGVALNFKERLAKLEDSAELHFRCHCNQTLESDFYDLVQLARGFSQRRNEIVHSVVRPVLFDRSYQSNPDGGWTTTTTYRFFLVPPTYTDRKYDATRQPAFIYTALEIDVYGQWFFNIGQYAL